MQSGSPKARRQRAAAAATAPGRGARAGLPGTRCTWRRGCGHARGLRQAVAAPPPLAALRRVRWCVRRHTTIRLRARRDTLSDTATQPSKFDSGGRMLGESGVGKAPHVSAARNAHRSSSSSSSPSPCIECRKSATNFRSTMMPEISRMNRFQAYRFPFKFRRG